MDNGNTRNFDLDDYNLDANEFGPNSAPAIPNQATDRDPRSMGNTANVAAYGPEGLPASPDNTPALGQIEAYFPEGYKDPTSIEAEPALEQSHSGPTEDEVFRIIKKPGEPTPHESKELVSYGETVEQEFNQTGDIDKLYESVRFDPQRKVA